MSRKKDESLCLTWKILNPVMKGKTEVKLRFAKTREKTTKSSSTKAISKRKSLELVRTRQRLETDLRSRDYESQTVTTQLRKLNESQTLTAKKSQCKART